MVGRLSWWLPPKAEHWATWGSTWDSVCRCVQDCGCEVAKEDGTEVAACQIL